jgi:ABC-type transport system substrate-binding protein
MLNIFKPKGFFSVSKWPAKHQWRQFFRVLDKKEKIVFSVFLILATGSFFFLARSFYLKNTEVVPAEGGIYIEGVTGSPRFINPIYAASFDVDRDLTELIYSGLMKYDENGKIVKDLAEEYKVLEEGKIYEFYLKKDLLWSDGQPLTADDLIFTIKIIQNPSFKSSVRTKWLGVTVEKISELGVRFELKNPSSIFLENCTLEILPKHIWQEISAQNFPLSIYNLRPIGSGPYKVKDVSQDNQGNIKSLELATNPNYSGPSPNIKKIIFYFFEEENDLIAAFKSGEIKSFSLLSPEKIQNLKNGGFSEYLLSLPRYFAVFLNPDKSKVFSDEKIRKALNYGTDKEEIINEVLLGKGKVVNSPVLPEIYGFEEPAINYEFNQETAKQLLEEAGFSEGENGIREKIVKKESAFQFKSSLQVGSQGDEVTELQKCLAKDSEIYPEGEITGYFGSKTKTAVIKFQEKYASEILTPYGLSEGTGAVRQSTRTKLNELCFPSSEEKTTLSFSLITVEQPALIKVANLLKRQWEALGINLEIKTFDTASNPAEETTLTEEIIKPRNYEMLLFGEVLGTIPDPFPFWHSSQVKDPGLNLAGYENKECDKLLENTREALDEEERKSYLEEFQELLIKDAPAIFLYSPDYIYLVSDEIKGVNTKIIADSSKRFLGIENWYSKTKRVWK